MAHPFPDVDLGNTAYGEQQATTRREHGFGGEVTRCPRSPSAMLAILREIGIGRP